MYMAILARLFICFSSSKHSSSVPNEIESKTPPPPPPPSTRLNSGGKKMSDGSNHTENYAKWRLEAELQEMNKNPPTNCSCGPAEEDDLFNWKAIIWGPPNTPFDGGVFRLSIEIPLNYPFEPPLIRFQTKVYHPNVDEDGKVHLNILEHEWSPALTIEKLLLSICSLLPHPTLLPEDHQNPIYRLYWNQREHYDKIAWEYTKKYAMGC